MVLVEGGRRPDHHLWHHHPATPLMAEPDRHREGFTDLKKDILFLRELGNLNFFFCLFENLTSLFLGNS